MSFFEYEYQQAQTTTRDYANTTELEFNTYPDISEEILSTFFYILNYGSIHVKYPYSITLKPIHAYLILYTVSGQGNLSYKEDTYLLSPDSILFIDCSPGFHLEVFNSSLWSYKWLYINGNNTKQFYTHYIEDGKPVYQCPQLSKVYDNISKLFNYLIQKDYNEYISSMLLNILLTNLTVEKTSTSTYEKIPQYILKIQNLFDTSYYKNFDLGELAKSFKVSKYTLSREFTKYIKISPIEYLIKKRIDISKKMLVETDYTISEIAIKIGIYNSTHFINLFKKRVGVTPLQFRKQISKDQNIFNDV